MTYNSRHRDNSRHPHFSIALTSLALLVAACTTPAPLPQEYPLGSMLADRWIDRSVVLPHNSPTSCKWSTPTSTIHCIFEDRSAHIAWTLGSSRSSPEETVASKNWQDAHDHCLAIGKAQFGGIATWRLPSLDAVQAAILKSDGSLQEDSLFALITKVAPFAVWPRYGMIWTATSDPFSSGNRFAVLRGFTSAPGLPLAIRHPKHWLCMAELGPREEEKIADATASSIDMGDYATSDHGCSKNYPGRPHSRFKASADLRDKIRAEMGEEYQHAIGGYGQLEISSLVGLPFSVLSSEVARERKTALQELLVRYYTAVRTVLGPEKKVEFAIVGHASPVEKGKYFAPKKCQESAVNRIIALSRAAVVRDITRALHLGKGSKTGTLSASHFYPLTTAGPNKNRRCGPFDCSASKRVEIFFLLTN